MNFGVVGAGGLGTWLGAALARAGHDVVLLGRRGVERDSVTVEGEYDAPARLTSDPTALADAELVLLTTKAHDQVGAAASIPPDVPVVAVQNGIPWWYFHPEARRVESVDGGGALSAAIDASRAIGCVAYLGARLLEPGRVATRPEAGLVIGEPDRSDSPRLQALAGALEEAGFPVRVHPEIRVEIWTKLMGNASFNPISLLTRRGLSSMANHPGIRGLVAEIMREITAIADAYGVAPQIDIEERLEITSGLGDHKPSTLQDLEAGRPLELAAIVHAPLELAEHAGVRVPALRAVSALTDLLAEPRPDAASASA
jgi:2-dehydropantoate 2-reductase